MLYKSNLVRNLVKITFIGVMFAISFSGCSTTLNVKRDVGALNLQSKKLTQHKSNHHIIAIISPSVKAKSSKGHVQTSQSPLAMMMMQRIRNANIDYDFNNVFTKNYASRLNKALEESISEIIASKGFQLKGPYSNLDDITYQDKKKIYLAFVPKINFTIDNKIIDKKQHRLYTHEDGVIQIGGSFVISMIEPMTGQVFIKRRINLSDFNIQEPYVYEKQISVGGNGLIETALDKGTAPDVLKDTTDVALTKAINEFYTKAIDKINLYLDEEEILSFQKDILKLKGLKRF